MRRKDREITEKEDIIKILEACKICHLAMVDDGKPYVIPLNYGYSLNGGTLTLYFHSASAGRKIDILKRSGMAAFSLCLEGGIVTGDTACKYGCLFASAAGSGKVEFIENIEEKCRALSIFFAHQTGEIREFNENQAKAVCVFKLVSNDFSGKKRDKAK